MRRSEAASFDEYRICKSRIVEMKRDPNAGAAWQHESIVEKEIDFTRFENR